MSIRWSEVISALALCVMLACAADAVAQDATPAVCTLATPTFVSGEPNIFNDQQEQDLGDALAELAESDLRIAPPAEDDQLTQIGNRLLATLPPTGVHYRFRLYDSGEINGFSLAGGRVYISRKLVAAVKNEDELAGVLAHEIGHISTHQVAIEFTRLFRIRLGVTQVGDRADIFAKVHRFFSTPAKAKEDEDTETKDQLAADHVALYAMVRAGYAAESFSSFLNESMMNKGKTGNWLSDAFGLTHEASQRYRSALKLIAELSPGCKGRKPATPEEFAAWRRIAIEERIKNAAVESEAGDTPIKLDQPMRPSLWRVRFSPDGRYVLAQDDASITVVDRKLNKQAFRMDAPDAAGAQFTPDSQEVVFNDSKLRVERWSVVTGQRTAVKEMVVYDGCYQTLLSADGKTLACVNLKAYSDGYPRISLRLIDVESGGVLLDKPKFYDSSAFTPAWEFWGVALARYAGRRIATLVTSPDGRYLVASAADRVLAYDLEHRTLVDLGGGLRDINPRRMCFLGPDRLFVVANDVQPDRLYKAKIFTFPSGQVVKESLIGDSPIQGVTKGRLLTAGPLKDFAIGLLDPERKTFMAESKFAVMDAWDNDVVVEGAAGGLLLNTIGSKDAKQIPLSLGPLPAPRAAMFSADGKYLAISLENRSQIWNLDTGKPQMGLMRPFRSVWINDADYLFGQFPKYLDKDAMEMEVSIATPGAKDLSKYEDKEWQYRDLQLQFKPMGKGESVERRATLEVKKMETQAVVWSKEFPHETPVCWPAEDNRIVLAWDLSVEGAKAEIKSNPTLQHELGAFKNQKRGLLIETVAAETGAPLQQVVIPEADLSRGYDDTRRARVSGDYVLVRGEHDNTVIYRIEDGSKVGEFFGYAVSSDAGANLIAAMNRDDEMLLVDERTGNERTRFHVGAPVRLARIVGGKQKLLLVLTADQVVHRFPLPE